ncbi:MAG: phage holin family protein [Methylophilaceae bacterium]|nr:phage holin family protein [Methylophilaceae bacterium]
MTAHLTSFLLHWTLTTFALWVASALFRGISFTNARALVLSALLLGLVNAVIRPVVVFLTLPLTLLTLGGFLLVINALMIMLVSTLVKGFELSGFWTAFFASLFISLFSFLLEAFIPASGIPFMPLHSPAGIRV